MYVFVSRKLGYANANHPPTDQIINDVTDITDSLSAHFI